MSTYLSTMLSNNESIVYYQTSSFESRETSATRLMGLMLPVQSLIHFQDQIPNRGLSKDIKSIIVK